MALTEQQKMEVKNQWKESKDKVAQISILAQLYATTTCEVRHVLYDAGIYPIGSDTMKRLDRYINEKGIGYGSVRNYIFVLSGYGAMDIKSLIADWNERPWGVEKFQIGTTIKVGGKKVKVYEKESKPEKKKEPEEVLPEVAEPVKNVKNVSEEADEQTHFFVILAVKDRIKEIGKQIEEMEEELSELRKEANLLRDYVKE